MANLSLGRVLLYLLATSVVSYARTLSVRFLSRFAFLVSGAERIEAASILCLLTE